MTIETLNRANGIKGTIDKLEGENSRISKLYRKKDSLSTDEIEELMQIAMINTAYTLKAFKKELEDM